MVSILDMKLRPGHFRVLAASSMEQIIGAAMSTVAGVMIPMLQLVSHPELSPLMQGVLGAIDLVGIAIGSSMVGSWADRKGYLSWFRLCPVIIVAASALLWLVPDMWATLIGLFFIGFGVGGGYSLDSAYISEIMPRKWKLFMVGVAKGTCALGFLLAALACYIILRVDPNPAIWRSMILVIAGMGIITILMRIRFAESPMWLLAHGQTQAAQKAARYFLGPDVEVPADALPPAKGPDPSMASMFKGDNLIKVIFTGIPWACEGIGVYGFGVFLPVLIMALGIDAGGHAHGIQKIIGSVEMTTIVNCFILPGFVVGLLMQRKASHVAMLVWGFVACAVGLLILWLAYVLHWPVWTSVIGFLIFEFFLSGGPHLITFVLPSQVFPVSDRSTGTGIAAMLGKVGAVLGVLLMPALLHHGGMSAVLWVSIGVNLLGALIGAVFGRKALAKQPK